jgi:hypothetical protein
MGRASVCDVDRVEARAAVTTPGPHRWVSQGCAATDEGVDESGRRRRSSRRSHEDNRRRLSNRTGNGTRAAPHRPGRPWPSGIDQLPSESRSWKRSTPTASALGGPVGAISSGPAFVVEPLDAAQRDHGFSEGRASWPHGTSGSVGGRHSTQPPGG